MQLFQFEGVRLVTENKDLKDKLEAIHKILNPDEQ
jgi:hypothetical protein